MQKEPQKNNDTYSWSSQRGFAQPGGGGSALLMVVASIYLIVLIGIVVGAGVVSAHLFSSRGNGAGGEITIPENSVVVEVRDYAEDSYGYSLVRINRRIQEYSVRIEIAEGGSYNYASPVYGIAFTEDGYIIATSPRLFADSDVRIVSGGTVYSAYVVGTDVATGVTVIKAEGVTFAPPEFGEDPCAGDRAILASCGEAGIVVQETAISSETGWVYYRVGGAVCRAKTLSVREAGSAESGFAAVDKVGRPIGFYCPALGGSGKNLLAASDALAVARSIVESGSVSGRWRIGFSCELVAGELLSQTGGGLRITYIEPESSLAAAGVAAGDILLAVNGEIPTSQGEIWDLAQDMQGMPVTARVLSAESGEESTVLLRFIPDDGKR